MPNTNSQQTGGQVLVEELKRHGAELAFGVPGESFLAALDAFVDHPELRFITCRQEGGAAMMAEAYGKLTNEPGICFVTRGPGATSASAGVHIAFQDSTPMILFIGQVARGMLEREAFQEIDYRRMYGQLAKWVAQVDDPARMDSGDKLAQALEHRHELLLAPATPLVDRRPLHRLQQKTARSLLAEVRGHAGDSIETLEGTDLAPHLEASDHADKYVLLREVLENGRKSVQRQLLDIGLRPPPLFHHRHG